MEKSVSLSPDKMAFLNSRQWPLIISAPQCAVILGVPQHTISILVSARILKPLGATNEGGKNKQRFFASSQVLALREDVATLSKIVNTLSRRWREKNIRAAGKDHSSVSEDDDGSDYNRLRN